VAGFSCESTFKLLWTLFIWVKNILILDIVWCFYSDGTHSLQSIHCWDTDAFLNTWWRNTHLWRPESVHILSKCRFVLGERCILHTTHSPWVYREPRLLLVVLPPAYVTRSPRSRSSRASEGWASPANKPHGACII